MDPKDQKIQELTKQLEDANKATETAKETLKKQEEFIADASVVIKTIVADKDLSEKVKTAIQATVTPPTPPTPPKDPKDAAPTPPTPPTPPADERVDQMELRTRNEIIARVESSYGYDKLTADDKKTLRSNVEKKLNQFGQSVFKIPVNVLEENLRDAYLLVDAGKAKEQGRLEGLVEMRGNEMGSIPSMGSSTPAATGVDVTEDQKKWAKKMDVPIDKVQDRLKELSETGVATYKPPEKKKEGNQAPSGQPTPPTT